MKRNVKDILGSIYESAFARRGYVLDTQGFATDRRNLSGDVVNVGRDLRAGLVQSGKRYGQQGVSGSTDQ
jgi:hypothetical protein